GITHADLQAHYPDPSLVRVTMTATPVDSGGHGSTQEITFAIGDEPPVLEIVSPTAGAVTSGFVKIEFDLTDGTGDPTDVTIANGITATTTILFGGTSALATEPAPTKTRYSVGWNTIGDLGIVNTDVTITLT